MMIGTLLPEKEETLEAHGPPGDGHVSDEAVREQLERILSSATFVRSKRLVRFLRFTIEQYLQGRQNTLKEYLVGVEVFNKMESFDPRIDSIVRVEARRLRSKLDRYYQTEGASDPTIIQFRRGSYIPIVLDREHAQKQNLLGNGLRSAHPIRTIAVSSFCSLSDETEHQYFCRGMTDDIVSALTHLDGVRVVSRNSPEGAKPEFMVEGSVRRSGNRLRVTAQLVDCNSGYYLWSETYERDMADIFAVQEEISHAIADGMEQALPNTADHNRQGTAA